MSSPEPGSRPRAPTITVDTSNVDENSTAAPQEITSSYTPTTANAQSLAVPARVRGDSVDSTSTTGSTAVASPAASQKASVVYDVDKPDAFKPIDDKEAELFAEENPQLPITKGHLAKLNPRKDYVAFYQLKGLVGLAKGLQTNLKAGLSSDENELTKQLSFADVQLVSPDEELQASKEHGYNTVSELEETSSRTSSGGFSDRKSFYGDNRLPARKGKSFLQLCWAALMDKILILLCVAAVVSLALGIYQSTRPHTEAEGANIEWVEGVAILVAVTIVVLVGAVNDWQKERQFKKLNAQKEDRLVKVVRSGAIQRVSVWDVFPGDVMCLDQGDLIPVDGIFIEGHNVSCDESSATGESDLLKKTSGHEVWKALHDGQDVRKLDPFIISGAKVAEGTGTFLVTAVGVHSSHGMLMLSLAEEDQTTPLQYKLNRLASYIAKLGSSAGLLLFIVLFIEFLAKLSHPLDEATGEPRTADSKGQDFIDILITAVTIIVVAVPEGLPLAVTLALAFATKRMTKDKNLVRHLQSCETMGNATVICSDKTGTLTQNVMTVVAAAFGNGSVRCGEKAAAASHTTDGKEDESSEPRTASESEKVDPFAEFPIYDLNTRMNSDVQLVLKEAIAINSTAFESHEDGKQVFQGSKTETALLDFAVRCFGLGNLQKERESMNIVQLIPFDSGKKCMGAIVSHGNGYRMFIKGASEIVLSHCTQVVDSPLEGLNTRPLTDTDIQALKEAISGYASRSLRTIGLAYKDFAEWPPAGARLVENTRDAMFEDINKDLIWQGVAAIQDPVRPGVPDSVKTCERAGVRVIMVTGDNVETARAIATECGILKEHGTVIAGPEFRKLNPVELAQVLPTLCVIARSSPQDKKYLVENLQGEGHVVAVTGDGTNDAPALKAADVGFSMGITGTEVAKEASDIIIMDDNFGSIVKALAWGRTVNDAVKKFLQFQITVNIVAVLVTFITAVASGTETSVLKAVQLLWINLIMDTFAALALATDPPSGSVIDRKPEPRNSSLISVTMWKQILGQSVFQFITIMVLYFAFRNNNVLGQNNDEEQFNAFIFNTFTWCQIFDAVNSRRIDNKLNIFEGITRNYFFIIILAIMAGGQTLIMFVGGAAFGIHRLTGKQWGISIGIGAITLPIGLALRFVPDAWLAALGRALAKVLLALIPAPVKAWWRRRKAAKAAAAEERERPKDGTYWDQVAGRIMDPADDLGLYTFVRGRRLDRVKTRLQHPKMVFSRSRSGSRSVLPALVAAGAMGASVGGGAISPSTRSVSRGSEEPPV